MLIENKTKNKSPARVAYKTKLTPAEIDYLLFTRLIEKASKDKEDPYGSFLSSTLVHRRAALSLSQKYSSLVEFRNHKELDAWSGLHRVAIPDTTSFNRYLDIVLSRQDYKPIKYIKDLEDSLD